MPPKKRGSAGRGRGRGRGGRGAGTNGDAQPRTTRASAKRKRKNDSESDGGVSSDSADEFDKSTLMSIKRYDFNKILSDPSFEHDELITHIEPEDLNMDYYADTGLSQPLHFRCDPKRLGMSVPEGDITVDDIREMVGDKRLIEVVEVTNQGSIKMELKEFVDYYKSENKTNLYNVLSLEFSQTPLADLIKSPELVRNIDWYEQHWPDELKQRYLTFNKKGQFTLNHTFPKVQYYCLMSPSDCYTDFHIDFGGTSVWYHVKKGKKIFWLIEPNDTNITMYEEFQKNPEQTGFFGDVVDRCARVELEQGDTMIIPAGWIHAVYTPADSLVFGGNFLHSMRASMQIRVYQSENKINISKKFRFPYLEELIFYVIADYVKEGTGRKYYREGDKEDAIFDYIGEKWIQEKGHHKPINQENFKCTVQPKERDQEGDDETDKEGTVNVIAMHGDGGAGTNQLIRQRETKEEEKEREMKEAEQDDRYGLEEEAEDSADEDHQPLIRFTERKGVRKSEEKEEGDEERREADMQRQNNDPTVFHDEKTNTVGFHSNTLHRVPIEEGTEAPFEFNEEYLSKISPNLLVEMKRLCEYIRKKVHFDVGEGITRPASLLNAFEKMLERRQCQLEEKGIVIPECEMPQKKRTPNRVNRSATKKPRKVGRDKNDDASSITPSEGEDTGGMSSQQSTFSDLPMLDPLGGEEEGTLNGREMKEEEGEGADVQGSSETVKQEDDMKVETGENLNGEPGDEIELKAETAEIKPKRAYRRKQKSVEEEEGVDGEEEKPAKEKKEKKEKVPKERKRRNTSSFEDALKGTPKPRTKKDKKDDKPMIVDGMPVAPMKDLQEKRNDLYNYNPLEDACALGHTPIQSAYRRSTKLNFNTPKFNTNKYKIEGVKDHLMDAIEEEPIEGDGFRLHTMQQMEQQQKEMEAASASRNDAAVAMDNRPPPRVPSPTLLDRPSAPEPRPSSSTGGRGPPPPRVFNRQPPPRTIPVQPKPTSQPITPQVRRTSFSTSTAMLTPQASATLPPYLPNQKPLISPIITPMVQRIDQQRRTFSMESNGSKAEEFDSGDSVEQKLSEYRSIILTLDALTNEMIQIDSA